MKCHRCHGLMVMERYYGPGLPYWGFRCVSCGEILDPVIVENRVHLGKSSPTRNLVTSFENRGRG